MASVCPGWTWCEGRPWLLVISLLSRKLITRRVMGMVEDTTRLLGLAGLAVVGVVDGSDGPVVDLVTVDERARRCPECGTWRVGRRAGG